MQNCYFSKSGPSSQPTVSASLEQAARRLSKTLASPRRESELILSHCLGCPLTSLFTEPARILEPAVQSRFDAFVTRRLAGEPLSYLTGHRGFWSLDFRVSPDTLIPRPETEALIRAALHLIPDDHTGRLLDLGTGCGTLAITLAHERPRLEVWATDQSLRALDLARTNACALGTPSIVFCSGDWFEALPQGIDFDWMVCNPPYLAEHDPALDQDGIRYEPRASLVAGETGLEALFRIIEEAPRRLRQSGWLIVEHAHDQAEAIAHRFDANGWRNVAAYRDIGGQAQGTRAAW